MATPVDERGQLLDHDRTKSGLVIRGQEVTSLSSPHFGMVEVTFGNMSSDWVHSPRLSLDFGTPALNARVFLPSGNDITAWYLATMQRNDIRDINEAAALNVLLLIGKSAAVVGGIRGERGLLAAGAGLTLAAGTVALTDAVSDSGRVVSQTRSSMSAAANGSRVRLSVRCRSVSSSQTNLACWTMT